MISVLSLDKPGLRVKCRHLFTINTGKESRRQIENNTIKGEHPSGQLGTTMAWRHELTYRPKVRLQPGGENIPYVFSALARFISGYISGRIGSLPSKDMLYAKGRYVILFLQIENCEILSSSLYNLPF